MADQVQETRETVAQADGTTQQTTKRVTTNLETVGAEPAVRHEDGSRTAQRIVYYIAGVLVSLLAIRFVLSLLGANRTNGFADLIYGITYPFVAPFFGLFNYEVVYGQGARLEAGTLVAMLVYWLIAVAIVKLIDIGRRRDT